MAFTPPFPKPHTNKSSFFLRFFRGWDSWLDVLFERSYRMKMGHYRQPGLDVFMVNEPTLVRRVLVERPGDYPKHRIMHEILKPLLGTSIFTTNGEVWQRQRRLMDQGFAQARLKLVFPLMADCIRDMERRIDAVADGRVEEIDGEMTFVTADIIFRSILSEHLSEGDARDIYESFIEFQHHAHRRLIFSMYKLPSGWARRRSERCAKRIREVLSTIIRKRYAEREAGKAEHRSDILASLMDAVDPVDGSRFSYEEMVDQICMLFLAGHETSASSLAWSLYLISHHPELQGRMHEEIMSNVGERDFEFADIKKLRLCWDVFRESLRLYPPVGFFVREAMESHCMRDKTVPAGSPVLISPWLIQRHADIWERPHEFDPDRFSTEAGKASAKTGYLPFSTGARVCIGAAFATQEAVLILASIVRRYRIGAVPEHTPKTIGRVTIRSGNGIKIRVELREAMPLRPATMSAAKAKAKAGDEQAEECPFGGQRQV